MTEDQFSKLQKSLESFRSEVNDRLDKVASNESLEQMREEVNVRFDEAVSQDQFTRMFKYMTSRFDDIEGKLDSKASQDSVDHLMNTLDKFASRLEDSEVERASDEYRFEKLLSWARNVSKKTGIPIKDL